MFGRRLKYQDRSSRTHVHTTAVLNLAIAIHNVQVADPISKLYVSLGLCDALTSTVTARLRSERTVSLNSAKRGYGWL